MRARVRELVLTLLVLAFMVACYVGFAYGVYLLWRTCFFWSGE